MPLVEVDGQQFEFPDGTPDAVIGESIRGFFGNQAPLISGDQNVDNSIGNNNNLPIGPVRDDVPRGLVDDISSVVEPIATMVSGAVAEPIAGIAGIAQTLNPLADQGAGAQSVKDVREALTYAPRTEAGRQSLASVGEALAPVAEALSSAEDTLGDAAFEVTGSPALAAAAKTIPTALLEVLGIASAKGAIKTSSKVNKAIKDAGVKKAVVEAAPDIQQLKDVSRSIYKELDNSGVSLQPKAYKGLVNRINVAVRKAGFDADLTPKTAAALKRFESEIGSSPSLTDIDTLRKVAQKAAQSIEPADASLGAIMVDNIDQFLDIVKPTAFKKGAVSAAEVTPKFKVARQLWGRARRSELINDAFEKAGRQASGFENGIVVQFRSILNNKKKSRFFSQEEIKAMDKVVKGTTKENVAKLIGRLGFSEGHATNLIGGSLGIAAGAQLGGPIGAVAVPVIGQVSRKLAQRMTRSNAEFADTVIRAGKDADKIAAAYLKNTPKKLRSPTELSELLSRPDIALDKLSISKNPLLRDAADIAKGNKVIAAALASKGAIESTQEQQ